MDINCNEIAKSIISFWIPFLTLVAAVVAIIFAIRIPRRIMVDQRFMSLTTQYRSPEMGFAIHCIYHFYKNDCKDNPDNINAAYKKRFDDEIGNHMKSGCKNRIDPSKTLHFQKRMIAYYFWDLARLCFESRFPRLKSKQFAQMVEASERNLMSLILQMAEAGKGCFEECENIIEPPDGDVAMNRMIKRLYDETEGMA